MCFRRREDEPSRADLGAALLSNFVWIGIRIRQRATNQRFRPTKMAGGRGDGFSFAIYVNHFPYRNAMPQHIGLASVGRVAEPNTREFLFQGFFP